MTYTYLDLCRLFQQSPTSNGLRRRLKSMVAAGFPPPLPGLPQRWSKPAVDAWLHNWGAAARNLPLPSAEGAQRAGEASSLQAQLQQIYQQRLN